MSEKNILNLHKVTENRPNITFREIITEYKKINTWTFFFYFLFLIKFINFSTNRVFCEFLIYFQLRIILLIVPKFRKNSLNIPIFFSFTHSFIIFTISAFFTFFISYFPQIFLGKKKIYHWEMWKRTTYELIKLPLVQPQS